MMPAGQLPFSIPEAIVGRLSAARHLTALTGAGISAESGVPTFRQAQDGLWSRYDPTELASPQAFERNPTLVWQWYAWRRGIVDRAAPNAGHLALVALEQFFPNLVLITQNVDSLHQRAGSRAVIELHGSLYRTRCSREGKIISGYSESATPPICPECGAFLRPDVVWFGEPLPAEAFERAAQASENSDVFLSIGTSSLVFPAASLPLIARQNGALLVEINPEPTPLSDQADYALVGPAGLVLPALLDALRAARQTPRS